MSKNFLTNDSANISRRILVIEDNFDSAEVLQVFLEIHGHEITVNHDAASGLETAQKFSPDVIICDINLSGGFNGYDVAEEIRRNEQTKSIFLIALSGYGRPEDKEKSKTAGFDSHFLKPTDFDALIELLNNFDRK
ncbi:MAG: response regulator [Actinomycetota bacterium]